MSNMLFTEYNLGALTLKNRMVMAPMTRSRASAEGIPSPLAIEYYAQRAAAGLMITEASQVSAQGVGYIRTPGNYTPDMVEAWKKITDAVHEKGGLIYLQIWHVGRTSHPDFHGGALPVAPSGVGYDGEVFTPQGKKKIVIPRALKTDEIPEIIEDFAQATRNAKKAGFDGVEIHGANSYLLDQFLRDSSNLRDDEYGGSIENRARFPLEVTEAVIAEIGASSVGYRINPLNIPPYGMIDSDPKYTFSFLVDKLETLDLGYLHVLEPVSGYEVPAHEVNTGDQIVPPERLTPHFRKIFSNTLIVNGGYTKALATKALEEKQADLVAFGTSFLANPDLVRRFKIDAPLNEPNQETFYQGEANGYIDYPSYNN